MYQLFKDFAGPSATIIAAVVAVFVTWRLGKGQLRIAYQQATTAGQQANTALDQLRYSLFEKRYAIYKCGIDLIRLLEQGISNPTDVASYLATLDEARFFFTDDICTFLDELKRLCEQLAMAYYERHQLKDFDCTRRISLARTIAEQTTQLKNLRLQMPALFENALQFPQLTGRVRGDLRAST